MYVIIEYLYKNWAHNHQVHVLSVLGVTHPCCGHISGAGQASVDGAPPRPEL